MNYSKYIEINPEIMVGKPVIKNTRITVELIIEKLSAGESMEQILASYPRLKRNHILAALSYAAAIIKGESIFPIAS
ncbi:MAG: DUF433 domain-containing protein [Bacteroidia bacterium]